MKQHKAGWGAENIKRLTRHSQMYGSSMDPDSHKPTVKEVSWQSEKLFTGEIIKESVNSVR